MSYNYDYDPWADNNNNSQQQQQQSTNYNTASNYYQQQQQSSDALNTQSYDYGSTFDAYQQQQQPQQQTIVDEQQYQAQQTDSFVNQTNEIPQQTSTNNDCCQGALCNLVRRAVPTLSPAIDTLSVICTKVSNVLFTYVNRDLLVSKAFYFFFYSAFGSLFPLMGVYFKQLGMNPAQVGILTGVRPFIEIFSAPFWNSLADKFRIAKTLLLFSLISWILFTYSMAHIRPPASACIAFNDSHYVLYKPYADSDLANYESMDFEATSNSNESSIEQLNNAEKKAEVLANEESKNDKRRRKRSVYNDDDDHHHGSITMLASSKNPRFVVANQNINNGKYVADENLFVDSNDFVDELVIANKRTKRSLFNSKESPDSEDTEDLESQNRSNDPDVDEDDKQTKSTVNTNNDDERQEESPDSEEKHSQQANDETVSEDEESNGHDKDQNERDNNNNNNDETKANLDEAEKKTNSPNSESSNNEKPNKQTVQSKSGKRIYRERHKTPPHTVGKSPISVDYAVNYNEEKDKNWAVPVFSTIVYNLDDVKNVFVLLLLLTTLGEFFSAPALTLADSATLGYLGDKTDMYGRQRMFGSLSWAVTLLFVGMALDNSKAFAEHPCGPHQRERSYTVCFTIFAMLMFGAFLTATQFRFSYSSSSKRNSGDNSKAQLVTNSDPNGSQIVTTSTNIQQANGNYYDNQQQNIDNIYSSTQPRSIFNTAPPINATQATKDKKFEYLEKWRSAMFAQRTRELPQWITVFKQFNNSLHFMYLFTTWFLGCGVGLVFTFLFWHLQDVGGTPTLFGICSIINHISEILAYFFSFNFIKAFGHTKVLSVGLACNVLRFLYVAFLTNPYYALPFELVQGITHSACFAACCSYISHVSKPELRSSTQGVMQGLHHGIGRACGTLIGGYMINAFGSRASFCIYGLLSGLVLSALLYIRKNTSTSNDDEELKVDDNEAFGGFNAPQGVPSAVPGVIVNN